VDVIQMAEQVAPLSQPNPIQPDASAEGISAEEYMTRYAHDFYEWVKGELVKMSPVSEKHDALTGYLYKLLDAYLSLNPIGQIRQDPFVMRLDVTESRREPDLQVILDTNPGDLTETAMVGPADICIEVVSEESVARDHGEKFAEYEKAGVREYWIVDPLRDTCRFNRLNEAGVYIPVGPGQDGIYETPLLPGLKLDVAILWQEQLPDYFEIGRAVQEMVGQG
jgi:Uma2 family endonuclease